MSPEALARLREVARRYQSDLSFSPEFQDVEHDLRAMLAAYDTAQAQVDAARAWAKSAIDHHDAYGEHDDGAYALLSAMDEAKAGR